MTLLTVSKVYDLCAKTFCPPTYFMGMYDFVRAFSANYDEHLKNNNSNTFFNYPDDYRFVFDCYYDTENGEFHEATLLSFTVANFLDALFIDKERTKRRSTDAVVAELETNYRSAYNPSIGFEERFNSIKDEKYKELLQQPLPRE